MLPSFATIAELSTYPHNRKKNEDLISNKQQIIIKSSNKSRSISFSHSLIRYAIIIKRLRSQP